MSTFRVGSFAELKTLVQKHARERFTRVKGAVRRSARRGAKHVQQNMPVAFGELRDATSARDMSIVTDAPHAAAVEVGSRPHWVPLEALVKWVKLRGMQGLTAQGRLRKSFKSLPGKTTAAHARSIASQLRSMQSGGSLDVEAPREIAKAIQIAIARHGTRPHHYMRDAIPTAIDILGEEIPKALPEP